MRTHRWFLLFLFVVALFIPLGGRALASSTPATVSEGIDAVLGGVDLAPWEEALREAPILRGESAEDLVRKLASGQAALDGAGVVGLIGNLLAREAASSMRLVLRIVVLAALGGVLQQMRGAFGEDGVSATGRFAVLLLCLAPLVTDLAQLIASGGKAISGMAGFVQTVAPALMTLLVAVGGTASAAVFQPAVAGATGLTASLISGVVMPLLIGATALAAVDALSENARLKKLAALLRSACHWIIGVAFTAFLAVVAIQGTAASSFDGVSLRTAKFAVDQFVPVVGGMFADTMDVLVGCTLLVKNGLGIAGMIALLASSIAPCLRIVAALACYRVAAAVLEPVADASMVRCLSEFSSVLTTLAISVASVAAMFVVTMAMVVSSGNAIVMIR